MASLQLDIVTPDRLVLSKEAGYVGMPGLEGEFGILPGHIPFIAALTTGCLYYKEGDKTRFVFVSGGFTEISDNKVTVLSESAETAENIDFARAEMARKRAEERLAKPADDLNVSRAWAALTRANIRLSLRGRG